MLAQNMLQRTLRPLDEPRLTPTCFPFGKDVDVIFCAPIGIAP